MKSFVYKGYQDDEYVTGVINASDEIQAEEMLLMRGIDVEMVRPSYNPFNSMGKKIRDQVVLDFIIQMKNLTKAGVPILQSLEDAVDTMDDKNFKVILQQIYDDVSGGAPLSEALAKHDKVFPQSIVSIVQVSEETGRLDSAFEQIERIFSWRMEMRRRAKKALVQPVLALVAVTIMIVSMMTFVVPGIMPLIKEMGGEVNLAGKALIASSNFLINYGVYLLAAIIAGAVAFALALKNNAEFRESVHRLIFKMPIVGSVAYHLKLSAIAGNMAAMVQAGVGFSNALSRSAGVANNLWLERKMEEIQTNIQNGERISDAFEKSGAFPKSFVRLIRSGEDSGLLDEALKTIADLTDIEARSKVDAIEPAIQPIITFGIGMIVVWVISAVFGPIYDVLSNIRFAG